MSLRQGARQFFERRGAPTPPLPYDAEVAWLKGEGAQYIDMGLKLSSDDVVIVSLKREDNNSVFGSIASPPECWYNLTWAAANARLYYGSSDPGQGQAPLGQQCTIVCGPSFEIDGQIIHSFDGISFSGVANAYVFARNNGSVAHNFSSSTIYWLSVKRNGIFVRDYIPVRFTNEFGQSEGAMYDRVSGQLFRNQGTGAFLYGSDKS